MFVHLLLESDHEIIEVPLEPPNAPAPCPLGMSSAPNVVNPPPIAANGHIAFKHFAIQFLYLSTSGTRGGIAGGGSPNNALYAPINGCRIL